MKSSPIRDHTVYLLHTSWLKHLTVTWSATGLTARPVVVLPGAEATAAAVATVELHPRQIVGVSCGENEQNRMFWTSRTNSRNHSCLVYYCALAPPYIS